MVCAVFMYVTQPAVTTFAFSCVQYLSFSLWLQSLTNSYGLILYCRTEGPWPCRFFSLIHWLLSLLIYNLARPLPTFIQLPNPCCTIDHYRRPRLRVGDVGMPAFIMQYSTVQYWTHWQHISRTSLLFLFCFVTKPFEYNVYEGLSFFS